LFTPLGSEDSASLRASLAAYADLLGGVFVSEVGLGWEFPAALGAISSIVHACSTNRGVK
jgi:hypothetical protein